jgi:hypothetical protein
MRLNCRTTREDYLYTLKAGLRAAACGGRPRPEGHSGELGNGPPRVTFSRQVLGGPRLPRLMKCAPSIAELTVS